MFKIYDLFNHREITDLVPEMIYMYMFKGMSLTQIEERLFNTSQYKGWLSKSLLNYYGIDTEKENKGIYSNKNIPDVVNELSISNDVNHLRVARILRNKYM